jgi:hypothetical protein
MLGVLPVALVRLRLGGRDVLVIAGRGRIFSFLTIKYESNDCTGTPYLDFDLPPELPALFLDPVGITAGGEVLVSSGDEVIRTINSEWSGVFDAPACDVVGPGNESVRPAAVLGSLAGFTPPFRLRGDE